MKAETENDKKLRRRKMIDEQLRRRNISSPEVLQAFETIDRSLFVPDKYASQAYSDCPLPIGFDQTISQPYVVALSLQELDAKPGQRVLDVGAGSGYQTALLACMGVEVFAIERIAELAKAASAKLEKLEISNAHIQVGDGSMGWADQAPFDRIVCGAAAPDVPKAWLEQLADNGRIVLPIGQRDVQTLLRIEKHGSKITRHEICGVQFVPLLGQEGWH